MNLDLLYEATELTGNPKYAKIATRQAEVSSTTHVRKDYGTYHVVNFDQKTGEATEWVTHQGSSSVFRGYLDMRDTDNCIGYADESVWARGQAWGIYGYAQCGTSFNWYQADRKALRTGREDFAEISRKLADRFLDLLPESGVPWWYVYNFTF